MRKQGFTLTELLISLATIALLAAILMPVFRMARESAKATTCMSNFKQAALAAQLYLIDYEDRLMPMNHLPGREGTAATDRTWVQIVQPYLRSFAVFKCPSDYGQRPTQQGIFDSDLVAGNSEARFYESSKRSNIGYNHQYLAPVVRQGRGPWVATPRTASQAHDPSRTILFVDSVWAVNESGKPEGGGRWLVSPPCRYERKGRLVIDSFTNEGSVYAPDGGWIPGRNWYGGAWAWHHDRVNVVRLDTSVKSIPMSVLTGGCEVEARWGGRINDVDRYLWDLR